MFVIHPSSSFKWGELLGSGTDLGQERRVQRADGLVDSVVIRSSLHIGRKLTSKVGDQQYDLTLGIISGGRRELVNLSFRFLQ